MTGPDVKRKVLKGVESLEGAGRVREGELYKSELGKGEWGPCKLVTC